MIYDCFTYHNEKEILDIRVNELAPLNVVHVLVESKYTFTGIEKKLEYDCGGIKYPNVYNFCADVPNNGNPWDNEKSQRDYIKDALATLKPNDKDVIIISDVDEVPSCEAVRTYNPNMKQTSLKMNHYGGYLNLIYDRASWPYCKITTWGLLKKTTPSKVRLHNTDHTHVPYGGWHFAWMGGIERVFKKFKSFSHQEPDIQQFSDYEKLKKRLENGQSIFGDNYIEVCEIDESYPVYVRNNKEKFDNLILKK